MALAWALVPLLIVAGAALLPSASAAWGTSLVVAAILLQWAVGRRSVEPEPGDPGLSRAAAIGLVLLATATAAALRFRHLGSLPEGLWYDEAEAGLEALRIAAGEGSVFAHYTDNTALPYGIIAALFSLAGPSGAAVRAASAMAGVALVPVCYFAGRELGGRGTGVLAAWFAAAVAWGVTFSRLGMPYMLGALFMGSTCWLLLRAFRTGRASAFALAGGVAGIGQYSYTTFRGVLPAAALLTVAASMGRRRRTLGIGLAIFWLTLALVSGPLALASYRHPGKYLGRIAEASLLSGRDGRPVVEAIGRSLAAHLGMFHRRGDGNGRHNLPGRPMLEPVAGAGLILGAAALLEAPAWGTAVVVLLFAGGMAGGVFSLPFEAPQAARSSAVIPLVAVAVGIGWWRWYRTRPPGRPAAIMGAMALAVLGLASASMNHRWYFIEQGGSFPCWSAHSPGPTWVARRWNDAAHPANTLIAPIFRGQRSVEFLAPRMPTGRVFDPQRDLPPEVSPGGTFLALSGFEIPYLSILERLYPMERRAAGMASASAGPSGGRGLIEVLAFPGGPAPEAAVAIIPEEVVRGGAGWLVAGDGSASTIVNLPAAGVVEAGDGQTGLAIDGVPGGGIQAPGIHLVRVAGFAPASSTPALRLRFADGGSVPLSALLAADSLPPGWMAEYAALGDGDGFARFEWRPDRYVHLLPLPRPYTVTWRGEIRIPSAGEYRFFLRVVGKAELSIDGAAVVTAGPEGEREGAALLTPGRHAIELTFLDDRPYSQVFLEWEPPGGTREPLPYGLVTAAGRVDGSSRRVVQ